MAQDSVRIGFDVLFAKLYEYMVNYVTFLSVDGGDYPTAPLWIRPRSIVIHAQLLLCNL